MRKGWQIGKLGEACTLVRVHSKGDALPYVGLEDIIGGTGEFTGSTTPKRVQSSTFKFTSDHILYGRLRPYLNKVFLPDFSGHCSTEIFPIMPASGVDRRYLYYWLSMDATVNDINLISTGARMPRANMDSILEFTFPLPAIPEQQRIVAILNEAFAGLAAATASAEKNIKNAHELFDSVSKSLLEAKDQAWPQLKLETLLDRGWIVSHLDGNHGNDYPRKDEFVSSGVPYISANCLENDSVDMSLAKFLSPQRAASFRKGVAQNNDVLFAHNATVGPVAMLYTDEPKVILSTSLTYYRCNPEYIIPEYLAHYMRSPEFKAQYEAVMRQSTRNQVPITKQREFFHLIPPLDEQRKISEKLNSLLGEVNRLEAIYIQRASYLSEIKQSLLQKAFSGELTSPPSQALTEAAE